MFFVKPALFDQKNIMNLKTRNFTQIIVSLFAVYFIFQNTHETLFTNGLT